MNDYTNVVTIRAYDDDTLSLSINGRDIPHLVSYETVSRDKVMLVLGVGQFNFLEGDNDLPRPKPVQMCPETDAPHDPSLNIEGDLVCINCGMPMDGMPNYHGFPIIKDESVPEDHVAVVPAHNSWLQRIAKFLRHR